MVFAMRARARVMADIQQTGLVAIRILTGIVQVSGGTVAASTANVARARNSAARETVSRVIALSQLLLGQSDLTNGHTLRAY